jgi:tetratricopeptide (TPR) repeat protein
MTAVGRIVLFVGAASLGAANIRAQCTPPIQQLITDHKYDRARAELEAQLARAPNDDAAMECIGRVLIEDGKAGDAVGWLEKAVKINGKSALHHVWLGWAIGTYAETANLLKRPFLARRYKAAHEQAVALDPNLVEARRGLIMFYAQAPAAMGGGIDKAREQAAVILKLNPMRGHIAYGFIAEREKDYAGAAKEYLAAIASALTPDSAINAHLSLGRVYITRLQDYDRGEKEVLLWLAVQPKDAPPVNVSIAHYCLGVVHQQRGRLDQARSEYQAALAENPKNGDAKKALASLQ